MAEALHPPTRGGLSHVDVAVRIHAHPVRAQELAQLASAAAELAHDLEVAAAHTLTRRFW